MVTLSGLRRNVEFAYVSEDSGLVYALPCTSSKLKIYDSVDEFNAGRLRVAICTTPGQATRLQATYYVFPCVGVLGGKVRVVASTTDFSWLLFGTGIGTGCEEVRAAKHAALRFDKIRVK